jgi:hypothetical protein
MTLSRSDIDASVKSDAQRIGKIAGPKTLGRSERHGKRIFPRGGDAGDSAEKVRLWMKNNK